MPRLGELQLDGFEPYALFLSKKECPKELPLLAGVST